MNRWKPAFREPDGPLLPLPTRKPAETLNLLEEPSTPLLDAYRMIHGEPDTIALETGYHLAKRTQADSRKGNGR